jgi:flagellar biosynthetic protein FlhB
VADEDDASKTEEPTAKKLSQAKQKGQVAMSQEVKHWFILLGVTLSLMFLSPWMAAGVTETSQMFIFEPHRIALDLQHLRLVLVNLLLDLLLLAAPLFGLLIILALTAGVIQSGLIWAPEKIAPKIGNLSLIKGVGRIASVKGLVEFAKGIAKIVIVSVVAFGLSLALLDDIEAMPYFEIGAVLDRVFELLVIMVLATFAVMTAIAGLDFAYQKYAFTKQMRMTKQEVKDEHKQSEGDPQVKARIRRLRMERAQQRMMSAVPESDVVITNPTHYAVALSYKMDEMAAPKVVAKGIDELALRIREVAEEHDVPIVENPPLARALHATCELDDDIPLEHYQAVAEVIGYVMRLRGDMPGGGGPGGGMGGGGMGGGDGQTTRH